MGHSESLWLLPLDLIGAAICFSIEYVEYLSRRLAREKSFERGFMMKKYLSLVFHFDLSERL